MVRKKNRTAAITGKLYAANPTHYHGDKIHDLSELGASYDSMADVVENYDYEDNFSDENSAVEIVEITYKVVGKYKRKESKIKIEKVK